MRLSWLDDRTLSMDGVKFVYSFNRPSTPNRFSICKPRALVEDTIRLVEEFRSGRIVELGIAFGGSTALIAVTATPERLIALELSDEPVAALDSFIRERSLERTVRPYYGVDQANRERVDTIVDSELDGEHLDLVLDDASHRYAETLASFETLFPRLRAGGAYVIEDWNWQLRIVYAVVSRGKKSFQRRVIADIDGEGDAMLRRVSEYAQQNWSTPPLERLILELVVARACVDDVIRDVSISEHQVVVRRGEAPVGATTFRLADLYVTTDGVLG